MSAKPAADFVPTVPAVPAVPLRRLALALALGEKIDEEIGEKIDKHAFALYNPVPVDWPSVARSRNAVKAADETQPGYLAAVAVVVVMPA